MEGGNHGGQSNWADMPLTEVYKTSRMLKAHPTPHHSLLFISALLKLQYLFSLHEIKCVCVCVPTRFWVLRYHLESLLFHCSLIVIW